MKKFVFLIIIMVLGLITVSYFIASDNANKLSEEEALKIGEEKYLAFLFIVSEAFDEGTYTVNDKSLSEHSFTCNQKNSNCVVKDFNKIFRDLFVSSINYQDVYSDNINYKRYELLGNDISFTNNLLCSNKGMDTTQKLELYTITKEKLVFHVTFNNYLNRLVKKEFVLSLEDGLWKISKAYYYDTCKMDYYIE